MLYQRTELSVKAAFIEKRSDQNNESEMVFLSDVQHNEEFWLINIQVVIQKNNKTKKNHFISMPSWSLLQLA